MKTLLGRLRSARLPRSASPAALAQSFPNRTVTIVVTSAAGALTDVLTRAVGQRLSQKWGQSVVVENRGGAGHNFAATPVMKAEPDGHTLLASETGFCDQPAAPLCQGQAALRPRDRLRSGRRLRQHSAGAAGQSVVAGEVGAGADRARQTEAGRA